MRAFIISAAAAALACSTPAPKSLPADSSKCVSGIVSDLAGSEDIGTILAACGSTLDDLITWLLNAVTPIQPGQAVSPLQVRYHRLLEKAQSMKQAHTP
jgi:hypothetical protein